MILNSSGEDLLNPKHPKQPIIFDFIQNKILSKKIKWIKQNFIFKESKLITKKLGGKSPSEFWTGHGYKIKEVTFGGKEKELTQLTYYDLNSQLYSFYFMVLKENEWDEHH